MKPQTKAMLMGTFVVLAWSTVATAFKLALKGMSFYMLLLIASWTALVVSGLNLSIKREIIVTLNLLKERRVFLKSALQGFLNPFLYYLILFKAYSLLPAQIAQPLNHSWQIVLILLMIVVLKQRVRARQIVGVVISFTGIVVLSTNDSAAVEGSLSGLGIFLALASTLVWASYWLSRINSKEEPSRVLFLNFLFSTIYLTSLAPFVPIEIPSWISLTAALYTGVFEMGITFILWGMALNLATNKVALAQITYLSPALSLILIHFVLGENISSLTLIGLALIIGGLFLGNSNRNRD